MDYGLSSGKIVYLSSAGNVGIGTTSPAYKLDVEGSIRATSNMYANQLFFEQGSARLVFDSASGATWIQGVSGMPMRLAGMSATDLPDLYMLADKTRVSGILLSAAGSTSPPTAAIRSTTSISATPLFRASLPAAWMRPSSGTSCQRAAAASA